MARRLRRLLSPAGFREGYVCSRAQCSRMGAGRKLVGCPSGKVGVSGAPLAGSGMDSFVPTSFGLSEIKTSLGHL